DLVALVEHGQDQVVLVRKPPVEAGFGHAGPPDDLVHAGGAHPVGVEQFGRDVDQLLARGGATQLFRLAGHDRSAGSTTMAVLPNTPRRAAHCCASGARSSGNSASTAMRRMPMFMSVAMEVSATGSGSTRHELASMPRAAASSR